MLNKRAFSLIHYYMSCSPHAFKNSKDLIIPILTEETIKTNIPRLIGAREILKACGEQLNW